MTRVKYDGNKVHLAWQVMRPRAAEPDEYSLCNGETPHVDLTVALQDLCRVVCEWVELEEDKAAVMTIRGVSLSWKNDEARGWIMGAGITALVTLSTCNSPLVINTPHLPREPWVEDDEECPILEAHWADAIEAVLIEAERYIDGKRAQGSLFTPDGQPTAEAANSQPHEDAAPAAADGEPTKADIGDEAGREYAQEFRRHAGRQRKPFRSQAEIEGEAKAAARKSRRTAHTATAAAAM